jgi:hypothetical protein
VFAKPKNLKISKAMDLSMKVKIWKVFESKKIKEPKHNS